MHKLAISRPYPCDFQHLSSIRCRRLRISYYAVMRKSDSCKTTLGVGNVCEAILGRSWHVELDGSTLSTEVSNQNDTRIF